MNDTMSSIRSKCIMALLGAMILVTIAGCEDESDMAINKVASPVLLNVKNTSASEVTAYFFELDKSGILDNTVGIDSIPLANLEVEVFASSASMGVFTTDDKGGFLVSFAGAKPNEYAGEYKGISFRFLK